MHYFTHVSESSKCPAMFFVTSSVWQICILTPTTLLVRNVSDVMKVSAPILSQHVRFQCDSL